MFISKKELESIRQTMADLNNKNRDLETRIIALQNTFAEQQKTNKELEEKIEKRFISERTLNSEEEQSSLIEEWMNGAKEGEKVDG